MFVLGPSLGIVQKYAGLLGVGAYLGTAALALWLLSAPHVLDGDSLSQRRWRLLTLLTFLCLAAAFYVIYPIANVSQPDAGSDRDDALNLAVRRLLAGNYPYDATTYLGNFITPLPGSLFLALPFVLLGNSAYQSFLWLFLFLAQLKELLKSERSALLVLWALLVLSPAVLLELVTGGDLLANSSFVFVFSSWLIRLAPDPSASRTRKLFGAALFGLGLCSRPHFALLVPLVLSLLARKGGAALAAGYGAIAWAVALLVSAPFYFANPTAFSPLHTLDKLRQLEPVVPHASVLIPLASAAVAALLALRRSNGEHQVCLRNCAVVLALPVASVVVVESAAASCLDFGATGFALGSLFFGAAAFAPRLWARPELGDTT